MKSLILSVCLVLSIFSINAFATSVTFVEMFANYGETLELNTIDYVTYTPSKVYWLAYTGPDGFSNVSDQFNQTTTLKIVDCLPKVTTLDYYNVSLQVWNNIDIEEKFITQIYLKDNSLSAVPEPATMLLFSIGLLGLAKIGRKI